MKTTKSTKAFSQKQKTFKIEDIDINNILVSKKESYGTKNSLKYFIGYNGDDVIRALCKKLLQMSFKVRDSKLLKKYSKIWNLLSTKFDSVPVYGDNDKYIKIKITLYGDNINTNFQGKKIPEENASYKCVSLIMLDSVIRANEKYCPQILLMI